jgi:hypothetical protein
MSSRKVGKQEIENERKTVYVVLPPEVRNGEPELVKISLTSEKDLREFMKDLGGGCLYNGMDLTGTKILSKRFEDISSGITYGIVGGRYGTISDKKTRSQVEDRILEHQIALAVANYVGDGAHVHRNMEIIDETTNQVVAEVNGIIIHKGGENIPHSVAHVAECAFSPQLYDIERLLEKVQKFERYAPSSSHFSTVTSFVPVLGGKNWSEEVIQKCRATNEMRALRGASVSPIWRVQPSGMDFKVVREFSTATRTLLKLL